MAANGIRTHARTNRSVRILFEAIFSDKRRTDKSLLLSASFFIYDMETLIAQKRVLD